MCLLNVLVDESAGKWIKPVNITDQGYFLTVAYLWAVIKLMAEGFYVMLLTKGPHAWSHALSHTDPPVDCGHLVQLLLSDM
jgi:hypothetical protein